MGLGGSYGDFFFFALMLTWQQVIRFKYKCFYYPVIRNIQELTWHLLWFGRPVLFYYGQDILVLGSSVERFCMVATEHRGHSLKFFTDHTNKAALFWYPIAVISPFQSMCDTTERISLVAMTMWRQHWSVRTVWAPYAMRCTCEAGCKERECGLEPGLWKTEAVWFLFLEIMSELWNCLKCYSGDISVHSGVTNSM